MITTKELYNLKLPDNNFGSPAKPTLTNNLKGVLSIMIGFVTFRHVLYIGVDAKKVAKGDKANLVRKNIQ